MAEAFDAAVNGGLVNPGTSLTWSHTCSGSNRLLLVGVLGSTAFTDTISGVTYAGVAMTRIDVRPNAGDRDFYLYAMVNPASGANNVVITGTTSAVIGGLSASYTGCAQTGFPDAGPVDGDSGGVNVSSFTISVTPVAANCWAAAVFRIASGTATAGAGTTQRVTGGGGLAISDSNASVTAGSSTSLTTNSTAANKMGAIIVTIAPATGSVVNSDFFIFF